ncbi:MAG TPA: hypothetical protein VES79_01620 [Solirubrobacteraceae bacterium]|nr:hypothetical protein [Solirubrobacteraceae bacterium]
MSESFLRIAFRVPRRDAERAREALLVDLPWELERVERGDEVELVFIVAPAEEPDLNDLRGQVGEGILEITRTEVPAAQGRPAVKVGRICVAAYAVHGLRERDRRVRLGWAAVVLEQ